MCRIGYVQSNYTVLLIPKETDLFIARKSIFFWLLLTAMKKRLSKEAFLFLHGILIISTLETSIVF